MIKILAPMDSVIVSVEVSSGELVQHGQIIALIEAMKMQYSVKAKAAGVVQEVLVESGQVLAEGDLLCQIDSSNTEQSETDEIVEHQQNDRKELAQLQQRLANTEDEVRATSAAKRHAKGYRTARENLAHLVDEDSFNEYGQLAVAAQRSRLTAEQLQTDTAADGIITGTATINAEKFSPHSSRAAVIVNDYSVLAGTQGYFHHHKLDRILAIAAEQELPVIMFTEGGGGRPGDTDATISMAGLNVGSFRAWAQLSGLVPRIAVNNGYCFAGNAALFGCADITIATKKSWIGMAGPAMIEGGGLGKVAATDIGPTDTQSANGVIDLVADDENHATELAKQCLSYFQGDHKQWSEADQLALREIVPSDRRGAYEVRDIISVLADGETFLELRKAYGKGIVTGFMRIEGKPLGVIANDCHHLGGAVDAVGAEKAARFIQLCDAFALPIISLADTPGFMVGPASEEQAAVRKMSSLFVTAASISTPLVAIMLRKGYGLGAMAMTGGSFYAPVYTAAWPSGEFGAMGLEGAVRLGFKKELAAKKEGAERDALFSKLFAEMIERGRATEAASYLEIDAVIDPSETRRTIIRALQNVPQPDNQVVEGKRRNFVDTW